MPPPAAGPGQPTGPPARAQSRARAAHQRGLKAGSAWRPAVAAREVRALLALGWAEGSDLPDPAQLPPVHHALAARLLMSLAHFESEQGRTAYGLELLDRAGPLAAPADRGVLLSQRGLLHMRAWRGDAALAQFDEAEALLRDYPDPSYLARTLLNRSFLHLNRGDVRRARADVIRCERVSAEHGLTLMTAKAVHNRGSCELLTGDLPAALQLFNSAAEIYRQQAPSAWPVLAMDKARALLSAGLAAEAAQELDGAISAFRRQRLDQDHAEAELARAQAALATGDLAGARRWAAAAMRRFHRRGNEACASLAELTRLRAQAMIPGRPALIAARARLIAGRLRDSGLARDADVADLIQARALVAAGRPGEARQQIAATRRGQAMTLEASLLRRLAQADLAEQEGRRGTALAELRAGLRLLHARRGRLGASTCRPAVRRSAPTSRRPGCGWPWNAARRPWSSRGWSAPAPRRSGSGRYSRRPIPGRRSCWPSFASSAT